MDKYLVVSFQDEQQAYEGTRALKDLHADGSISLYGYAVLGRGDEGRLEVKQSDDQGPVGMAVGGLVGGMVGLLGGPVGAAVGMGTGALIGSWSDLGDAGVGTQFVADVASNLQDANAVVVAEVGESWLAPVDGRMEALGGTVIRQARIDVEDAQFIRNIEAMNAEMDAIDAEMAQASAERKAKLEARRAELKGKIDEAHATVKAKADQVAAEAKARIQAIQAQAEAANAEAKADIEKRLAETKAAYQRRAQLFGETGEAVVQALS